MICKNLDWSCWGSVKTAELRAGTGLLVKRWTTGTSGLKSPASQNLEEKQECDKRQLRTLTLASSGYWLLPGIVLANCKSLCSWGDSTSEATSSSEHGHSYTWAQRRSFIRAICRFKIDYRSYLKSTYSEKATVLTSVESVSVHYSFHTKPLLSA